MERCVALWRDLVCAVVSCAALVVELLHWLWSFWTLWAKCSVRKLQCVAGTCALLCCACAVLCMLGSGLCWDIHHVEWSWAAFI
jgi:hypothetical protein